MTRPRSSRMSLQTRMMWWQVAIIMPLLLAALLHHLYLMPRYTKPLLEIANSVTNEIMLVKNQQLILQVSAMPINDYLINGQHREIRKFASERQRVEQGFNDIRAVPFKEVQERRQIEAAWREWKEAIKLADELLAIPHPVGDLGLNEKMKYFDNHINGAAASLEKLYSLVYRRLKTEQEVAQAAHNEMHIVTIGAFVVSLLFSALIGSSLIHSILDNLASMREGAGQLAKGSLNRPVSAEGIHELEQLADSFNDMAMKLQLHDAALEDLAIHDGLTGLENRRMFDSRLDEELHRVIRYHHPLSLLMLDIDYFKSVNDGYGHLAGDVVLRNLACTIKNTIRPVDYLFRYGGEEFCVIAVETDATGAMTLAERIRVAVEETDFPISVGTEINVTISIGVATLSGTVGKKEDLIAQADRALYEAKSSGRNRVHLYHSLESDRQDATKV